MKKMISAVLIYLLAFTCTAPAFADVGAPYSPWSRYYIQDARSMYRILPDSLQNGDYTQSITREEFCELAYETIGYIAGSKAYYDALQKANENGEEFDVTISSEKIYPAPVLETSPFTDTDNVKIVALSDIGIIEGRGNSLFVPNDFLTREEAATILKRMADHFSLQQFENPLVFTDADRISGWAMDGVNAICGMGIMNGMGNGIFSPDTNYTKEQAIATMIREICSVPYMNNRQTIAEGKYFIFNFFWLWVENENGEVLFRLPQYWATYDYRKDYGYNSMSFLEHDGKLLAASAGSSNNPASLSYQKSGTTFFDIDTGKELLFLPSSAGYFYALTKDHQAVIMESTRYSAPTVDAAYSVYAVYDFNGNELIPTGSNWTALYAASYVDEEYSFNYVWK